MELSLIQSIIPVLATYGIAPKPAKHLKKYSPQLWAIHEDMVLKNPQYNGRFEKARSKFVDNLKHGKTFITRCMTRTALGTPQDSPRKNSLLEPTLMLMGNQWGKAPKIEKYPFLKGGFMSTNVSESVRKSFDRTPHGNLWMKTPNKTYDKNEVGEQVSNTTMLVMSDYMGHALTTSPIFLGNFLFEPMNTDKETAKMMKQKRIEWTNMRKKYTSSQGGSFEKNIVHSDEDSGGHNYYVLDMSSSESERDNKRKPDVSSDDERAFASDMEVEMDDNRDEDYVHNHPDGKIRWSCTLITLYFNNKLFTLSLDDLTKQQIW
jgi:hypothetical protein